MARVNLTYTPGSGDQQIIEQIVADLQQLASGLNGNLDASTNVNVATAATITGKENKEGSSSALTRADHGHIVQGFENLASAPSTGNFVGRLYYNTSDGKLYMCTDAAGSGTFIAVGNIAAADLVVHGSRHSQGGADALANGAVSNDMMGRSIVVDDLSSDSGAIGTSWTTVYDGTQFTCAGTQIVQLSGRVTFDNAGSSDAQVGWRLLDTDNANAYVAGGPATFIGNNSSSIRLVHPISEAVSLATGNHTLRLQAVKKSSGGTITVKANTTDLDSQGIKGTRIVVLRG